jgi:hypothetical protein
MPEVETGYARRKLLEPPSQVDTTALAHLDGLVRRLGLPAEPSGKRAVSSTARLSAPRDSVLSDSVLSDGILSDGVTLSFAHDDPRGRDTGLATAR